jgi:hypothetical protein
MSELEERLRTALGRHAQEAPSDPAGLAAGARTRLRRRRRTWVAAAAAAVVVAVVTPVAVVASRESAPEVAVGTVRPAWRTESFHDVTLQVPSTWGYGDGTACGGAEASPPRVSRPQADSQADTQGGCPADPQGVHFVLDSRHGPGPGGLVQGQDGWTAVRTLGRVTVAVVDADEAEAQQVLDSIHTFTGPDANGCYPVQRRIPAHATSTDGVPICSYDRSGDLETSERLTGDDATQALAALQDPANVSRGITPGTVCVGGAPPPAYDGSTFAWITPGGVVTIAERGTCDAAIQGAYGSRDLTDDVLHWTLSPAWSGDLGVPLPPRRTLSTPPAPSTSAPTSAGWRTESWHGVTLQVPATWGTGCPGPSVWREPEMPSCFPGKVVPPAVTLAPGVDFKPRASLGAAKVTSGRVYDAAKDGVGLDGAGTEPTYLGLWFDAAVAVEVRGDDRALVAQILATVHEMGDQPDANGCYADQQRIPETATTSDGVTMCRYEVPRHDSGSGAPHWQLVSSIHLAGGDAQAALDAVRSAPDHTGATCTVGTAGAPYIWITPEGRIFFVPSMPTCRSQIDGAPPFTGTSGKLLDDDVRHWLKTE